MIRNIQLITGALLFTAFVSCSFMKTDDAIAHNDFLVHCIDTVVDKMLDAEDVFYSGTYEEAKAELDDVQLVINTQLTRVKEEGVFDGNKDLHQATIDWLQFYKDIADKEYSEVVEIIKNPEFTEEDEVRIDELIQSTYDGEETVESRFGEMQAKAAKEYNFVIEDKKTYDDITE